MWIFFLLLILFTSLLLNAQALPNEPSSSRSLVQPIVTVEQGKLRGKTGEDLNGRTFYSFQGIPYGKPPVGESRFKASQPAEPWIGVRDATIEGSESVSRHQDFFHPIGSEDCLNLNVYTPELPITNGSNLKAVMVWIHGGGFTVGSSKTESYGPEFLVKEDIVLVTINYRLGILGFLSLEDTSLGVPGNAGLKDMVLALKWVQKNIAQFGGDPNSVTIFGESAGSAACHFLILSPLAKGLFHRAILQSSNVLNPWVIGKRSVKKVAEVLGHISEDEKDALNFLRTVPAEKFIYAQDNIQDDLTSLNKQRPICPVIEKPNPEAFLTEDPLNAMLSGNYNKVPIIIGYNNREGMVMEVMLKKLAPEQFSYRQSDLEKLIPYGYNLTKGSNESLALAKKIEQFYYGKSKDPGDDADSYYIMNTDTFFYRGIYVTLKALLKTSNQPIYSYRFTADTALNFYKKIGEINNPGACHADDLGYLFKSTNTPEIQPNSIEETAIHRLTKFWTNFAKKGNPNSSEKDPLIDVEWPRVTEALDCLNIGEELSVIHNPKKESMQFWDDVSAGLNSKL